MQKALYVKCFKELWWKYNKYTSIHHPSPKAKPRQIRAFVFQNLQGVETSYNCWKRESVWMQSEENTLALYWIRLNRGHWWKANPWWWMAYKQKDSLKRIGVYGCRIFQNLGWNTRNTTLLKKDNKFKWILKNLTVLSGSDIH